MTTDTAAAATDPGTAVTEHHGGYGGYRLQPARYQPRRVPREVQRHTGELDALAVGSPGKVGVLQLGFARTGGQTELVEHFQKSPLQIMRPLYFDPRRPDMPLTFLMSTGGGVLQGDRLRTDLTFGPGSSAHVTTQAHTKLYRMEQDYAAATVNLVVGADAFVEYLPDPSIPFAGSRFYQHTNVVLDESATLVAGETVYAGRLARDERHDYDVYASDFEVRRPDGSLVAIDRVRLTPADAGVDGLAVLAGRDVLAMLYVLTPLAPAAELADLLHEVLSDLVAERQAAREAAAPGEMFDEMLFGVSVLPGDAGVWLRILGDDTVHVSRAVTAAWGAVHVRLTGLAAPAVRKS